MSAITPLPGRPFAPAPPEPGSATSSTARAAPAAPTASHVIAIHEVASPAADLPPDPAAVQRAADDLQQTMENYAKEPRDVAMRYDDEHRVVVVEVRNRDTGELILSYPPEKILKVRDALDELMGAMIDRKI